MSSVICFRNFELKYLGLYPTAWTVCLAFNFICIFFAYTDAYRDDRVLIAHPYVWDIDKRNYLWKSSFDGIFLV